MYGMYMVCVWYVYGLCMWTDDGFSLQSLSQSSKGVSQCCSLTIVVNRNLVLVHAIFRHFISLLYYLPKCVSIHLLSSYKGRLLLVKLLAIQSFDGCKFCLSPSMSRLLGAGNC